jgi:hypothetical protein
VPVAPNMDAQGVARGISRQEGLVCRLLWWLGGPFKAREADMCELHDLQHAACNRPLSNCTEEDVWEPHTIPLLNEIENDYQDFWFARLPVRACTQDIRTTLCVCHHDTIRAAPFRWTHATRNCNM